MGAGKVISKPIGCLLKILITLAVIIVVLVIFCAILVNLTPRKLNLQDTKVGDQTIEEMGFADVKIWDIYTYFKALSKPDEDKIVTNKPTDEDKTAAEDNTSGSSLTTDGDGNTDYSAILTGKVTYDNQYLLTYRDTTLAYIFTQLVQEANTTADANESMKFLADLNADFEEITIKEKNAETGTATLRLVASFSLSSFKEQIKAALPSAVANIMPIPEKVYVVSYLTINVDENGVITYTSQKININDTDSVLTDAIFSVLASSASDTEGANNKDTVNAKIGEGFSYVVKNLGLVGTATSDAETKVVTAGTISYGAVGLTNGQLTVITYVVA